MVKLYTVSLSDVERLLLQNTIGTASARISAPARILLIADAGPEGPEWSDTKIAEAVEVSRPTVERLRKRAVTEGVEAALQDRPRWENRRGKLDGEEEARLTALACNAPPAGQKCWTLHLLANYFGDREGVPVSSELVRRVLINRLSPHLKEQRCIPPEQNAEFCSRTAESVGRVRDSAPRRFGSRAGRC
jgi:transposase